MIISMSVGLPSFFVALVRLLPGGDVESAVDVAGTGTSFPTRVDGALCGPTPHHYPSCWVGLDF